MSEHRHIALSHHSRKSPPLNVLVVSEFGAIKDLLKSALKKFEHAKIFCVSSNKEWAHRCSFSFGEYVYSMPPDIVIYDLDSTCVSPEEKLGKMNELFILSSSRALLLKSGNYLSSR